MRRQILRACSAALAAGGMALLTVGAAGAAANAAASTHATSHPVIYTSSQGGYTASGRWFRFVATTVKVPPAGAYSNYAEVVLGGATVSPVTLAVAAGGARRRWAGAWACHHSAWVAARSPRWIRGPGTAS